MKKKKNLNVLITGGTGILSSGIARESAKQGYNTFAITRGNHSYRNVEDVTYIQADVWNNDDMNRVLENLEIDIVVECLVYNCEELKKSLEKFADRCKQYIFISTTGVYNRENGKVSENTAKDVFEWQYSKDKIECEEYLKKFFRNRKNHFTIIRPFVTYGGFRVPFPITSRANQWTIFERIKKNCPIVACTNVNYSIVHIDDFSYGVVGLFENKMAYNEDFHIAEAGKERYWDDVVKASANILGKNVDIVHVPLDVFKKVFMDLYEELKWNKTTELLVDDTKLKKAVPDFKQSVSLEKGLKSTIASLNSEYENNNKVLDMEWWYKCDLALIYAYIRKKLNQKESEIVKEYIKTIPTHDKLKIISLYVKQKLRVVKRFIKTIIKK